VGGEVYPVDGKDRRPPPKNELDEDAVAASKDLVEEGGG